MSDAQSVLRAAAASRFRVACPDLAPEFDLDSWDGLLAAKQAASRAQTHVVCVLPRCEATSWMRATCAFALGLDPARAARWRRCLTTTVFLAGNPANLRDRFAFDHLAGELAWLGPADAQASIPLRRMLRAFEAPDSLPTGHTRMLRVPGDPTMPPRELTLHVATAGVSLARTLVDLHHLLVESIMDGHLGAGDMLTVRTVPRLDIAMGYLALRVDVDHAVPGRLRAYAGLVAS